MIFHLILRNHMPFRHDAHRYSRRLAALLFPVCAVALQAQIPGRNVNMVSGTTLYDGDPFLQRQNEPSIAVSTRNPLHLLAGANDYRTVDIPITPDGGDGEQTGDAWIGVYKSFDGGQTWRSRLLPGFPQDESAEGSTSPLKNGKYRAGADVVVRSGTNGMFYLTGLAFDRIADTPSAIFLSTFVDNNNNEAGDTIQYRGTRIVAASPGGPSAAFIDKPWLAVDVPRAGALTCSVGGQVFAGGNVYVSYTAFYDDETRSQVMFTRSQDCGQTWSMPIPLSDGATRDQGASIAVDPASGTVYVSWRRAPKGSGTGQILVSKSTDGGATFPPSGLVAEISPFDQGSSLYSFRTISYPTMTVDSAGRVYIAWAEAGLGRNGEARIVIATSTDGLVWTRPGLVEPSPLPVRQGLDYAYGHQLMPSLTYGGGKLMLVFYDTRLSHMVGRLQCLVCQGNPLARNEVEFAGNLVPVPTESGLSLVFNSFISDQKLSRRQTIDVRAGIADPGPAPVFAITQVSEYLFGSPDTDKDAKPIVQLRFNPPDLPLFATGSRAFLGDYIDVASAPPFVPINVGTRVTWRANTSEAPVYHAAWTDNRDVRPPPDGKWETYTPPAYLPPGPSVFDPTQSRPACIPDRTGMRNQNIYSSRITTGVIAGSPGNNKTLGSIERAFVVFVQNPTDAIKTYRLSISAASQAGGGSASFVQSRALAGGAPLYTLDVQVAPRSSASRSVFVNSPVPHPQIPIQVTEITGVQGSPITGAPRATVLLNPDLTNPDLTNPDLTNPDLTNPDIRNAEVYNPDLTNPDLTNPDLTNPDLTNPDLTNPDLTNPDLTNPDLTNPDLTNPDLTNPDLTNYEVRNPDLTNPDLTNPDLTNRAMTDATWKLVNKGNTAASYGSDCCSGTRRFPPASRPNYSCIAFTAIQKRTAASSWSGRSTS